MSRRYLPIQNKARAIALAPNYRQDWAHWSPRRNSAVVRSAFSTLMALADVLAITLSALVAGTLYHLQAYDAAGPIEMFLQIGLFISLVFIVSNTTRTEYSIARYMSFQGHARRVFGLWNLTFIGALGIAFITKTTGEFSRATIVIFYAVGLVALTGVRGTAVRLVRQQTAAGMVSVRRIFLVGSEAEIEAFSQRHRPRANGMHIVTAAVLRGEDTLRDDLALAAASARMLRPDDVFILLPWSATDAINSCLDAFLRVPAALHLGADRVLDRFNDARVTRLGSSNSLRLVGRSLSISEVVLKRMFDLSVGTFALIALAPVLALVMLAIRFDSKGPVLFRQTRYGFNQIPFRIYKFRSMHSMDNGRVIQQARKGDPRITRVGYWLRRLNLDELPQLINVLCGEMSLVGPRPHAMAHDQLFDRDIALYARRHNVKPGITGWAQVNGFRGETSTNDIMRQRVEHDLWYIDNWSLSLDIRIMWLTVFSRKAYRNAQ